MNTEAIIVTVLIAWSVIGLMLAFSDHSPGEHWLFGYWLSVTIAGLCGYMFWYGVIRNDDTTQFNITYPDGHLEVLNEDDMYRRVDDLDDGVYTIDVYTPREYDTNRIGG